MINVICIGLYFFLMLIWVLLLIIGSKRYRDMVEPLETSKFLLKDLYPIGFMVLELIRYKFDTNFDKKRLSQCRIVYGEQYYEYYYQVNMAEKVTYLVTGIAIAPILGPLVGTPLFSLFGVFAGVGMFYYADTKITDIIKQRDYEISRDFSDVVSKMALLINAGMITREAWENIAFTGAGTLYEEMRTAVSEMRNSGVSDVDAYLNFGNRCGVPLVKKFVSALVQNLSKSNKDLVKFLKAEAMICWEEKKHLVRRKGEEASNKMMIPLGMILVGVFIMILVPVMSNMGF